MKGFFRYLAPFAPDYSGAVSALYAAGGLVVLCDPGGCSGNVAGYDEPRFYGDKVCFYSSAIREMDTIFGRDDKLKKKICAAVSLGSYKFVALVGTPAVSVIGTDLAAAAKAVEQETGIPAFSVCTSGMENYSFGEAKAIMAFVKKFLPPDPAAVSSADTAKIGIFGATPLNRASDDDLVSIASADGGTLLSENTAVDALRNITRFKEIVCYSPGAIGACRLIKERFGIPYSLSYPETPSLIRATEEAGSAKRILIVHQQGAGNTLRNIIRRTSDAEIAVGSFFLQDSKFAEKQDLFFQGEDELAAASKKVDLVYADPMYRRALSADARFVPLVHCALSGC
ncbi:MAG: hypothetical protein J6W62_07945 [Spirochaetia bacterium]|nr:hypothetical protein [Spirochaetia bacterium]